VLSVPAGAPRAGAGQLPCVVVLVGSGSSTGHRLARAAIPTSPLRPFPARALAYAVGFRLRLRGPAGCRLFNLALLSPAMEPLRLFCLGPLAGCTAVMPAVPPPAAAGRWPWRQAAPGLSPAALRFLAAPAAAAISCFLFRAAGGPRRPLAPLAFSIPRPALLADLCASRALLAGPPPHARVSATHCHSPTTPSCGPPPPAFAPVPRRPSSATWPGCAPARGFRPRSASPGRLPAPAGGSPSLPPALRALSCAPATGLPSLVCCHSRSSPPRLSDCSACGRAGGLAPLAHQLFPPRVPSATAAGRGAGSGPPQVVHPAPAVAMPGKCVGFAGLWPDPLPAPPFAPAAALVSPPVICMPLALGPVPLRPCPTRAPRPRLFYLGLVLHPRLPFAGPEGGRSRIVPLGCRPAPIRCLSCPSTLPAPASSRPARSPAGLPPVPTAKGFDPGAPPFLPAGLATRPRPARPPPATRPRQLGGPHRVSPLRFAGVGLRPLSPPVCAPHAPAGPPLAPGAPPAGPVRARDTLPCPPLLRSAG